jgi:hypothetical protein
MAAVSRCEEESDDTLRELRESCSGGTAECMKLSAHPLALLSYIA